jgi:putative heme-binding domain-containing protein
VSVRRAAVVTFAAMDWTAARNDVLDVLRITADETEAQSLWRALLSVQGVGAQLASELNEEKIPVVAARAGLRPAREGTQHQALVPVLLKQAGLALSGAPLSPAEMLTMAKTAIRTGDAARGEAIYRRPEMACVVCHAIGGAGGHLGPDLTSIGASAQPDYLVEAMLYPSAKIKEGYHSMLITTKDGRELNGMITRETPTEVVLRDAANVETSIAISAIASRTSVGSLMPGGLMDSLLAEERLDLIKFLSELGKPGDYDASQGGVARAWKVYAVNSRNEHLGAERVAQGDFSLESWTPVLSLVNGYLPQSSITAIDRDRNSVRGLYVATRFNSATAGQVGFKVSGDVKNIWLNGKLVAPGKTFNATASAGDNTIVIQLPQDRPAEAVKLSATGVTFLAD